MFYISQFRFLPTIERTADYVREHQHRWITDDLMLFRDTIRRFGENELVQNEERWWRQPHVDRKA